MGKSKTRNSRHVPLATVGPLTVEVSENGRHCFHDGNRASIVKHYPADGDTPEGRSVTVAEVWPNDGPNGVLDDAADAYAFAAAPRMREILGMIADESHRALGTDARNRAAVMRRNLLEIRTLAHHALALGRVPAAVAARLRRES